MSYKTESRISLTLHQKTIGEQQTPLQEERACSQGRRFCNFRFGVRQVHTNSDGYVHSQSNTLQASP